MPTNPTRADYMSGKVSHEEFYTSVSKAAGIVFRADHPLVIRAKAALAAGDVHLNTIPLREWDMMADHAKGTINRALKEHADYYTQAGGVCVFKQAVKNAAT